MKEERKQKAKYGGIALLLVLLGVWGLWMKLGMLGVETQPSATSTESTALTVSKNESGATRGPRDSKVKDSGSDLIQEDIMIDSLLKWYDKRSGKPIKVIKTNPIRSNSNK